MRTLMRRPEARCSATGKAGICSGSGPAIYCPTRISFRRFPRSRRTPGAALDFQTPVPGSGTAKALSSSALQDSDSLTESQMISPKNQITASSGTQHKKIEYPSRRLLSLMCKLSENTG